MDFNTITAMGALMKEMGYRPDQRVWNLWRDHSGEAIDSCPSHQSFELRIYAIFSNQPRELFTSIDFLQRPASGFEFYSSDNENG